MRPDTPCSRDFEPDARIERAQAEYKTTSSPREPARSWLRESDSPRASIPRTTPPRGSQRGPAGNRTLMHILARDGPAPIGRARSESGRNRTLFRGLGNHVAPCAPTQQNNFVARGRSLIHLGSVPDTTTRPAPITGRACAMYGTRTRLIRETTEPRPRRVTSHSTPERESNSRKQA
jgi:hypothetical protein